MLRLKERGEVPWLQDGAHSEAAARHVSVASARLCRWAAARIIWDRNFLITLF